MGGQIVLQNGEICHGRVHHRRETTVAVLGHNNVSAPSKVLSESLSLDFPHSLIHREWHTVARDDGIEYDVRVGELLVHAVESLDEL